MNDAVYSKLIELCTDICRRNGKQKLLWFADKATALAYEPAEGEMLITVHRWFANKSCPGDWLFSRLGDVAEKVNAALAGAEDVDQKEPVEETPVQPEVTYPEKLTEGLYRVRLSWSDSRSQIGAYRFLSNAKKRADNHPGYSVFTDDGVAIYPVKQDAPVQLEETGRTYKVVKGDTLFQIAKQQLGKGSRYTEIVKLNGLKTSTIYVGQVLKLPEK